MVNDGQVGMAHQGLDTPCQPEILWLFRETHLSELINTVV